MKHVIGLGWKASSRRTTNRALGAPGKMQGAVAHPTLPEERGLSAASE